MTLTELRYIATLARTKHFGHAATACFVSQSTLSSGIKKLENELGVTLFERGGNDVSLTPIGQQIVAQALLVLEQTNAIKEIAKQNKDPLTGAFKLGVIYTIAPYLLPQLVNHMIKHVPQMPLILQENFTVKLIESLRQGQIDAAIMALPITEHGLMVQALYDEAFVVALPKHHPLVKQKSIHVDTLQSENLLLLGQGHCFRDQVLQVCPESSRYSKDDTSLAHTFEGSSLETIRHMVASGLGITILPHSAVSDMHATKGMLRYRPFKQPQPSRRIVIVWRKSFTRHAAIDAIKQAIASLTLPGTNLVHEDAQCV